MTVAGRVLAAAVIVAALVLLAAGAWTGPPS
jgi:hypothetical protein